jgi:DNA-binding response OmpR family regulator
MTNTKRILVVDDDEALCTALEAKFGNKGYEVTICKDGVECMEILKKEKFDAILTDLHMPNLDGFGVLEQRGETVNADAPLYIITNLGSDQYCEKAMDLGAKKCFVKSLVTLRDVVEMVHREIT